MQTYLISDNDILMILWLFYERAMGMTV